MRAERRWLLLWIALAAFVVARATARPDHRGVLLDHLEFGRRLLSGTDVYGDWRSDPDAPVRPLHAPYPPSFGLLTAPFAIVDHVAGLRAARAAWALLQVLAIAALFAALRRLPTGPAPPSDRAHRWLVLATLLVLARFVLRDMHGGGGNLINVALCTLALACAENGRPAASGWLLGLSLATKPTQVLLLPLFWVFGHRRAAGHALAAGATFVLVTLCLQRFDIAPWQRWIEGSLALGAQTDAFARPSLGFPEFEWMNQSLRCASARWLDAVPAEYAERVALGVTPGLGLGAAAAAWATRLLLGTALAALLVLAFRARSRAVAAADPEPAAPAARTHLFAAALVLSLLASPLCWKAHHVALVPAIYLLALRAVGPRSTACRVLLAAFVLCCSLGQQVLGDDGAELLNSLYVLTLFDVVMFAALWLLARQLAIRK